MCVRARRLYSQAEALCKHYKLPILLIELEGDKQCGLAVRCGNDWFWQARHLRPQARPY